MVDTTEATESQYINADIVKESKTKVLTIQGEGAYEETAFGLKLTLPVRIDGKSKTWRPNRDTAKNLTAYGVNTADWVGKRVKLRLVNINGKASIIGEPVDQDLVKGIMSEPIV